MPGSLASRHEVAEDEVAEVIGSDSPAMAEKLQRVSPHWMRHMHSTTSIDLHCDEVKRARKMDVAFGARCTTS